MSTALQNLWTPLAATPLLWPVVTLTAYVGGRALQRACGGSALASPVLIAIFLVAGVVLATGTSYHTYFSGAQFINFLLGPATIALAIPLARNARLVRENLHSIGLALLAGSLTSIVSGVAIVWALGGSRTVALSMAPKAVTTPIAVAVSQQIGGVPALTAALAILGRGDHRPAHAARPSDQGLACPRTCDGSCGKRRCRRAGCRPQRARSGVRSACNRTEWTPNCDHCTNDRATLVVKVRPTTALPSIMA